MGKENNKYNKFVFDLINRKIEHQKDIPVQLMSACYLLKEQISKNIYIYLPKQFHKLFIIAYKCISQSVK